MKLHWVGCFPPHQSVGDHAQTLAVQYFLNDHFADYEIARYTLDETAKFFHASIKPNDLILIHSGGGFGDLYLNWHKTRKRIIGKFPHNRIIQLPVSVFYRAPAQFEADKIFFSDKHNLTILCRHENAAALLGANFGCQVEHFPDFVYYLKPRKAEYDREGVLFVLRNDEESVFETDIDWFVTKLRRPLNRAGRAIGKDPYFIVQKFGRKLSFATIENSIRRRFPTATVKDVQVSDELITDANREKVVFDVLDYYQRFKLVVTDRFHALVFAALTNTPALALPTRITLKAASPNRVYPLQFFSDFRKRYIENFKPFAAPTPLTSPSQLTVLEVVRSRRSVRKWTKEPVPNYLLKDLLEAGYWAPTASNTQAVGFYAVTNPEIIAQLCQQTSPWFKNSCPSVVIVVYYDVNRALECGVKLTDWTYRFVWQDTAVAMNTLMLTAESFGLKSCWASVLKSHAKRISEILKIPKGKMVTCMLLLGYSNQKVSLDAVHQGRPIRRRWFNH